jgi:hypothetical protein
MVNHEPAALRVVEESRDDRDKHREFRERGVSGETVMVAWFMGSAIRMELAHLPGDSHGAHGVVLVTFTLASRAGLVLATLQDLNQAIILIGGAELVLQSILAGAVEDALGAVAMSHKDLPSIQNISQRNTAIPPPLLQGVQVINEDDKVLRATLVKDLMGAVVGARHLG